MVATIRFCGKLTIKFAQRTRPNQYEINENTNHQRHVDKNRRVEETNNDVLASLITSAEKPLWNTCYLPSTTEEAGKQSQPMPWLCHAAANQFLVFFNRCRYR